MELSNVMPGIPSLPKRDHFLRQVGEDGKLLRIDFVLSYEKSNDKRKIIRRRAYERNLREAGLILEHESSTKVFSLVLNTEVVLICDVSFVKIHIPWETLITYADLMKIKMPIKKYDIVDEEHTSFLEKIIHNIPFHSIFSFSNLLYKEEESYFTCAFRKDKLDMFIIKNKDSFFSNSERSRIVWEVLQRAKWEPKTKGFGVRRLISLGFYTDAFPIHEGPSDIPLETMRMSDVNDRFLLRTMWAKFSCWYKVQPLDLVRRYFGEKVAIYFAWLGLYTQTLVPVSIIGFFVFFYGVLTYRSDFPSEEICRGEEAGELMCPMCDGRCTYWRLVRSCITARFTHILDNEATIFFAIVMSFWGTMFLELWKRKEHEIQHDWDVADFESEEIIRPEFEARCSKYRQNPITGLQEPFMPMKMRFPRYVVSFVTVLFMLCLVLSCVFGIIVYRIIISNVFNSVQTFEIKNFSKILTTSTAAVINLFVILIMNKIYAIVAVLLTNAENNRTDTHYEDSLTMKMYCFKFVNMYSSVFYIAFVKGNLVGRPGNYDYTLYSRMEEASRIPPYMRLQSLHTRASNPSTHAPPIPQRTRIKSLNARASNPSTHALQIPQRTRLQPLNARASNPSTVEGQDLCDPAGCLIDLGIQLVIIFGGNQVFNNIVEIGLPMLQNRLRKNEEKAREKTEGKLPQWEKDYRLQPPESMFVEYLEMVVQFGFVTLFVAAMPLAPLFALCNNIMELRLDAYKLVTQTRRPLPTRAQDIGVWFSILKAVATLAVLTNALVIGFTSDTIPKLVFKVLYSNNGTLEGYVRFSLSRFATRDFQNRSIPFALPSWMKEAPSECMYRDFREPYDHVSRPYAFTASYWHITAWRFIFVIIFEHAVFFVTRAVAWFIPDVPRVVKMQMEREKFLTREVMFASEAENLRQSVRRRKSSRRQGPRLEGTEEVEAEREDPGV